MIEQRNADIANMEDVTEPEDTVANTSVENASVAGQPVENTSVEVTSPDDLVTSEEALDDSKEVPTNVEDDMAQAAEAGKSGPVKPEVDQLDHDQDHQDRNFKALRDRNKELERELKYKSSNYSKPESVNEDPRVENAGVEDYGFADDDLIEGRQLKAILNRTKKIEAQQQVYVEQQAVLNAENKLKGRYSDFDDVLNADNLAVLKARDPELVNVINNTADWYSKGIIAYTAIKDYRINETTTGSRKQGSKTVSDNSRKLDKNLSRPGVGASAAPRRGSTPLSKANDFLDDYSAESLADHADLMRRRAEGRR